MTPTPEDIEVATLIEHVAWCPAHLDIKAAARLIADHTAPLRELAEIGRLAVEEEKLRRALKAKYLASGGKTADCMGLYDDFYGAAITHREAVCAYLAKHPTEKP